MSLANITRRTQAPPLVDFIKFRAQLGWGRLERDIAEKTLAAGLCNVTAYDRGEVVGFGRIVGDGVIYFYVQDLIVSVAMRRRGLGALIMADLIEQVKDIAKPGATLGLMSAVGKEGFYKKFGFIQRPSQDFGAGMILLLDALNF